MKRPAASSSVAQKGALRKRPAAKTDLLETPERAAFWKRLRADAKDLSRKVAFQRGYRIGERVCNAQGIDGEQRKEIIAAFTHKTLKIWQDAN